MAGPGPLEFIPPKFQQCAFSRFISRRRKLLARATCFSAIDFAIIVPCVRVSPNQEGLFSLLLSISYDTDQLTHLRGWIIAIWDGSSPCWVIAS